MNRINLKKNVALFLDIVSIAYIFIIIAIIITGGYRGNIFGIHVSARALKDPIIIFICLIFLRYVISKESIASAKSICLLKRIESYLIKAPYKNLFIIITLYLIYFKLLQHFTFDTYCHDLSIFDYPIHYTLKGNFLHFPWWSSVENYLGVHFSPIILAIIPFYLIYDSPITLLILQGIFISLALIPLFKIAEEKKIEHKEQLYIGIAFIFNPFLWQGFLYNFHLETLYPFLLLSAFYTATKNRFLLHTLFIILTLSIKEEAFIYCIMLELYFVFFSENKRLALFNIALSLSWGIIVLKFAMPSFQGEERVHVLLQDRYGHIGSNYEEIILYIFSHPFEISKMIFNESLLRFTLSFALLPLLYLKLAIFGLPSLFVNLLSNFETQIKLSLYYTMSAIPFFLISTIYALKRFDLKWRKRLLIILTIISLSSFRTSGCMIPTSNDIKAHLQFAKFNIDQRISAQSNIFPHLPRSTRISVYPKRNSKTEIIMLKLTGFLGLQNKTRSEYYEEILNLIDKGGFVVNEYLPPFVILRREVGRLKSDKKKIELRKDLLKLIEKG